jgi:hypothetical protein
MSNIAVFGTRVVVSLLLLTPKVAAFVRPQLMLRLLN